MAPADDNPTATRTLRPSDAASGKVLHSLLVVREGSSSVFPLPAEGAVLIGRSPEAELRVDDASLSRRHARLLCVDGGVRIVDLESHNGTRVNGTKVAAARTLLPGDVVSIGTLTLVLKRSSEPVNAVGVVELVQLRARLQEEVARAARFDRAMGLIALAVPPASDPARVQRALAPHLGEFELVAWVSEDQLMILLPELADRHLDELAKAMLNELARLDLPSRAGVARSPDDGADADALLSVVRDALASAAPGQVLSGEQPSSMVTLANRVMVVADPAMLRLHELIRRLATSDLPVLLTGETGTGKENAAFAVHAYSSRASRPFVPLNCAALQETLVESELFGYERGAFSGAVGAKPGLLETAAGGTLFLDEVGELSAAAQAKLLRALEAKRITRVGDLKDREVDIRVVAATNRDLEAEVAAGRFRQDLFYRLSAATVVLPPLRERRREVPILARLFLDEACRRAGRDSLALSAHALDRLARHPWPGNIRELKNLMEYAAATSAGPMVEESELALKAPPAATAPPPREAAPSDRPLMPPEGFRAVSEEIKELERRRMAEALEATGGVQTRAAQLIGMPLRTFVLKLKQYGLGGRRAL